MWPWKHKSVSLMLNATDLQTTMQKNGFHFVTGQKNSQSCHCWLRCSDKAFERTTAWLNSNCVCILISDMRNYKTPKMKHFSFKSMLIIWMMSVTSSSPCDATDLSISSSPQLRNSSLGELVELTERFVVAPVENSPQTLDWGCMCECVFWVKSNALLWAC